MAVVTVKEALDELVFHLPLLFYFAVKVFNRSNWTGRPVVGGPGLIIRQRKLIVSSNLTRSTIYAIPLSRWCRVQLSGGAPVV